MLVLLEDFFSSIEATDFFTDIFTSVISVEQH